VLVQVTSCCMAVLKVALMLLALLQKFWWLLHTDVTILRSYWCWWHLLLLLYQYKYPHLNIIWIEKKSVGGISVGSRYSAGHTVKKDTLIVVLIANVAQ